MRLLFATGTDEIYVDPEPYLHGANEASPFSGTSYKSRLIRVCAALALPTCGGDAPAPPDPNAHEAAIDAVTPTHFECPSGLRAWGSDTPNALTCDVCALDTILSAADHGWLVPQPPETDCDLCNIRPSFQENQPGTILLRVRYTGALAAGDLDTDVEVTATAYLRLQTNGQTREVGFALPPLDKAKLGTAQLFQLTAHRDLNLTSNDQLQAAALVTVVDATSRPPFSFLTELVRY
jgi:hypothetical protein